MKKSITSEVIKLLKTHNRGIHLPLVSLTIELDQEGFPSEEFVLSKATPMETLGMISILKDHLKKIEVEVKKTLENMSGNSQSYSTKVFRSEEINSEEKKSSESKPRRQGNPTIPNLKHLKDLF